MTVNSALAPTNHDVVAAAAHELRLPLSHIKGFVSTLRRTDVEWDEATRNDYLAEIVGETDRLAELLQSLLETGGGNGTGTQTPFLEPTHPASVVNGAMQRVRGLLADRVVRLDVAPNLRPVGMNASQMERVLANLLQNAVKYSPVGTPIDIVVRMNGDAELEFVVRDLGPGVPIEDHERIFQPYSRGQLTQGSDAPGHGLGLAICYSIVRAHGGWIDLASRPGGGACFSVVLPIPQI
jgi:two-component system sensor histidine kinase KdpD